MKKLHRIFNSAGMRAPPLNVSGITNRFKFANKVFDSIGRIKLFLSTAQDVPPVEVEPDVVQPNTQALMGIDYLKEKAR